jgi:thioredoxin reductase (NADPH)
MNMEVTLPPSLETRRDQIFPTLTAPEITRLHRFGAVRSLAAGSPLVTAGLTTPGLQVMLSGQARVTPRDEDLRDVAILSYGPGSLVGELSSLSGAAALVDVIASTDVTALLIPAQRLRDLMVEEVELGERIMRALILRRVWLLEISVGGPIIVGLETNRDVLRLETYLNRNGYPHRRLDSEHDPCALTLIERFGVRTEELPIVLCPNGDMLRNPTEGQLASCLGLLRPIATDEPYDVVIVGAGPAGLGAAVYAASEGLKVMVLDCRSFGGQAGASARIENYLGFPTGIRGLALMARAHTQAQKFGAEMAIPAEVKALRQIDSGSDVRFELKLADGTVVPACTVVIASGAEYRRLPLSNVSEFEGTTLHYWASPLEARLCSAQEVALVGGGNSAGQAAVYLSAHAAKVWMIVRGKSLSDTMSTYLCERIAAQPNIEVLLDSEVTALQGTNGLLESVTWRHRGTNATMSRAIHHIFLLIGADPNSSWLSECSIEVDAKGFVRADAFAANDRLAFETSVAGVFAIGDIRAESVKRVAAAVGEGAQVVAALHRYLSRVAQSKRATMLPVPEVTHG